MGAESTEVTTSRAGGVLAATCLSTLVVNANTSAVAILLPAISDDTGMSVTTLQWAVTGYSLVGAAVIVTSGALGDIFGRKRVFQLGLLLFVASCVLIALSSSGGMVIAGRMIQGAAGATILACGMSLLSVAASGAAQMKAITLWGAASAAGAALGPLVGGVLVDSTGWQGLFWIDAAIAAVCIPLTMFTVRESRDPDRPHSIDVYGTILIAVILVPIVLALSEGGDWGWTSLPTIGCLVLSAAAVIGFVMVERRVAAPLVDLQLFANRALVGSTLAILIVAGVLNGLMYVLSLYFQDPAAYGMSAFEAGLATLPAAGALIAITPLITPVAVKVGTRAAIGLGFVAATIGLVVLSFLQANWVYAVLVAPLVIASAGLGLSNGPASAASTSVVSPDEVGQASGISNMARYVGGSLAVAAVGTVFTSVTSNHTATGASAADALASGLARACLLMAIMCACGVALAVVAAVRHRPPPLRSVDRAAAAASATHTIPTPPLSPAQPTA